MASGLEVGLGARSGTGGWRLGRVDAVGRLGGGWTEVEREEVGG